MLPGRGLRGMAANTGFGGGITLGVGGKRRGLRRGKLGKQQSGRQQHAPVDVFEHAQEVHP
ncbi:hypothetical protein D3C76_1248550 [compost metagenome]